MKGQVQRLKHLLDRHGELVTLQTRAVGTRNSTTGQAALTYSSGTSIYGFVGRPLTRAVPQESGTVTETAREFLTQSGVSHGDRIVLQDGTYVIATKPTEVRSRGRLILYKVTLVRLEFV